jgi:hypothetical protein
MLKQDSLMLWQVSCLASVSSFLSFNSTSTLIVFSQAVTFITMFIVAAGYAAVWWHHDLVRTPLVGGHAGSDLVVGVKDLLGLLCSFPGNGHCDSLGKREVLFCKEVLLELRVADLCDEQARS